MKRSLAAESTIVEQKVDKFYGTSMIVLAEFAGASTLAAEISNTFMPSLIAGGVLTSVLEVAKQRRL